MTDAPKCEHCGHEESKHHGIQGCSATFSDWECGCMIFAAVRAAAASAPDSALTSDPTPLLHEDYVAEAFDSATKASEFHGNYCLHGTLDSAGEVNDCDCIISGIRNALLKEISAIVDAEVDERKLDLGPTSDPTDATKKLGEALLAEIDTFAEALWRETDGRLHSVGNGDFDVFRWTLMHLATCAAFLSRSETPVEAFDSLLEQDVATVDAMFGSGTTPRRRAWQRIVEKLHAAVLQRSETPVDVPTRRELMGAIFVLCSANVSVSLSSNSAVEAPRLKKREAATTQLDTLLDRLYAAVLQRAPESKSEQRIAELEGELELTRLALANATPPAFIQTSTTGDALPTASSGQRAPVPQTLDSVTLRHEEMVALRRASDGCLLNTEEMRTVRLFCDRALSANALRGAPVPQNDAKQEALTLAFDTLDMRKHLVPRICADDCMAHGTDSVGDRFDCDCGTEDAIRTVERAAESSGAPVPQNEDAQRKWNTKSICIECGHDRDNHTLDMDCSYPRAAPLREEA